MGGGGASHGATEIELAAVVHSLAMYLIIEAPRKVGEVRKSGDRSNKGRVWAKAVVRFGEKESITRLPRLASFRDSCMVLWKRPQLGALAKRAPPLVKLLLHCQTRMEQKRHWKNRPRGGASAEAVPTT